MSLSCHFFRARSHSIRVGRAFHASSWKRQAESIVVTGPAGADSTFLIAGLASFLLGHLGRSVCMQTTADGHMGEYERKYQWQLSGPEAVQESFDKTIGNLLAGLSSASLDIVWHLFSSSDQIEINKHMQALDHLGMQIRRTPNSELLRKLYVDNTRACAKILLPRIHDMLQNGTDSRGRSLSENHKEKLRILKCKLQSSLHSISMDNIRGHTALKQDLEECVVWPCLNSGLFKDIRRPPRGILLYGPPGNGKTMIAKALAARVGVPFYQISSCDVISKYHGDSEKNIRAVCEAARAEPHGAVVFIDEIDSLAPTRDGFGIHSFDVKQINELLHQIDGIKMDHDYDKVIYIGATNRPWSLDPALLRRLPKKCYLGPPNYDRRLDFVEYVMCDNAAISFELTCDETDELIRRTNGYSYSALDNLIREACMEPVRELVKDGAPISEVQPEEVPPVRLRHLRRAAEKIKGDVEEASLKRFESWSSFIPAKDGRDNSVQSVDIVDSRGIEPEPSAPEATSEEATSEEDMIAMCIRLQAENIRLRANLSATHPCSNWVDVARIELVRMLPLVATAWIVAKAVRG